MAPTKVQQPDPRPASSLNLQYGIYMHNFHSESKTTESQLVATAMDWNTANGEMRIHAGNQIDKNPHWGATREIVTKNIFEIIDSSHIVRLRYDIASVSAASKNAKDAIIWKREENWLARDHVDGPPVHYGIYVDLNCDSEHTKKSFFVGGYQSLGEANHAMKASAHAYLKVHSGAKLTERCVELLGEKGEVKQRYVIEKGRWTDGAFIKEEEWRKKEQATRAGTASDKETFTIPTPRTANQTTSVLRLSSLPRAESRPQTYSAPQQPKITSQLPLSALSIPDPPDLTPWCTCHSPDDGLLMLLCENEDCPIQWYHGRCVGLSKEPRGQWWCPQCAPAQGIKKKATAKKAKGKKRRRKTG